MKLGKKCISLILALVMVLGLTVSASAAETETVTVQLSPNITVKLDGEVQTMTDVNGNPVYPVLYGGTTYLPIRAVGNMLGLDVDWDGATQTVILEKSDGKTAPAKTDGKAPANAKPTEITVQINPNITVKYNGKAQAMTDVNGNPVYPMLYGGTTYLPVRAVSNMLGVKVDWDGDTQTVILESLYEGMTVDEFIETYKDEYGGTFYTEKGAMTVDEYIAFEIENSNPADKVKARVANMLARTKAQNEQFKNDPLSIYKTSEDAEILGENHIGYDWCEIDWSTASDGYIRAKLNKQISEHVICYIVYAGDEGLTGAGYDAKLTLGQWTNITFNRGDREYAVTIQPDYEDFKSDEEFQKLTSEYPILQARFTAKITNPDAVALLSDYMVDFEHAPNTCAKALELTKDCKTDAEKITTIFEYVAKTVTYDYVMYEKNIPMDEQDLNPDHILESKSGVCVHYATLMAAMLRSLDIPCKAVHGYAGTGGSREGHAWVVVRPDVEGLDKVRLGAGTDPSGWIRLDPTWGSSASGRRNAANDSNYETDFYY